MNDRALLTIGVLILLTLACTTVAILAPGMKRTLWIAALSVALLEFVWIPLVIAFRGINHRDLSVKGFLMLLISSYLAWIVFRYLFPKIATPATDRSVDSN